MLTAPMPPAGTGLGSTFDHHTDSEAMVSRSSFPQFVSDAMAVAALSRS